MNNDPIKMRGPETWTQAIGDNQPEQSDESLPAKAALFLRLCGANRKVVLVICTAGITISLLFAFLLPAIYTSTTTLMPPDSASSASSMLSLSSLSSKGAAGLGKAALGLGSSGDLFVGVLSSRTVQDRLVARFTLASYYQVRLVEDARKRLAADTHISLDTKSGLISISIQAKSPVLASQLAQAYVEELNRAVTDDSTSSARQERIFLEERVKEVKQDLDGSAKALSQFSAKSGTIDIPSQAKAMIEAGLKLQGELIEGRSQLAALRENYSEDNWRVRQAEARIQELQRQIDKMGGLLQGGNPSAGGSGSVYPSTGELPVLGLTFYDLERKVEVEEALWENLTKEYESAKVQEAKEIPAVRVLDSASVPQRKSGPSRRLIVGGGTLFSLILAFLWVFAGNMWGEMDPQKEPKKLMIEVFGGILHRGK